MAVRRPLSTGCSQSVGQLMPGPTTVPPPETLTRRQTYDVSRFVQVVGGVSAAPAPPGASAAVSSTPAASVSLTAALTRRTASDQAFAHGGGDGLRAAASVELRDDVVDHVLDRTLTVRQPFGHLAGGMTLRD